MAEQSVLELIREKNKLFVSANENNRIPCPHEHCSECIEETFFDEKLGLENHYRIAHKGQFTENTTEEGRKLRRKLHFEIISAYLDALFIETENTEDQTRNKVAYQVQYMHIKARIYAKNPEAAAKVLGLLLNTVGVVPPYKSGNLSDRTCTVTIKSETQISKYDLWKTNINSQAEKYCKILAFCKYFQCLQLQETTFQDHEKDKSCELDDAQVVAEEPSPGDDPLVQVLKTIFGLSRFRPHQREIIEAILSGQNVITLMPTGGGKSLCFMLPAYMAKGVSIVIVPYNSLMYDLHRRLTAHHILSGYINQFTTQSEMENIVHDLNSQEPKTKVLITTPESLQRPSISKCLEGLRSRQLLARFIIDEVHCINQASHQFRPDYLKLGKLHEEFSEIQIVGLTATASPDTLQHITTQLGIQGDFKLFQAPITRTNIEYKVCRKNKLEDIHESVKTFITDNFSDSCGIIYCNTPNEVLTLSYRLETGEKRFSVGRYAGEGLDEAEKQQGMREWLRGEKQILVATKAAGTGIDKPDVRYVIHCTMPESIDEYYQQSGRCGRDGLPAVALMYYRSGDRSLHIKHIGEISDSDMRTQGIKRLVIMEEYCYSVSCRKKIMAQYFGEEVQMRNCDMCDNCISPNRCDDTDVLEYAKCIVDMVPYLCNKVGEKKLTPTLLASVIRGANVKEIRKNGLQEYEHYGCGKGKFGEQSARDLLIFLTAQNVLTEVVAATEKGKHYATSYITLGRKAEAVRNGEIPALIFKKRK